MNQTEGYPRPSWGYIVTHFFLRVVLPYLCGRLIGWEHFPALSLEFVAAGLSFLFDLLMLMGLLSIVYLIIKKLRPIPPQNTKKVIWKKEWEERDSGELNVPDDFQVKKN
ncbi:MAG: hypothetical protein MRY83_14195 [Flavobacteriales bacterium]|nr:hypothetical protein [Flavobacteriales bacterium]